MRKFSLNTKFIKSRSVITKNIDDKVIILDPVRGVVRTLNETAGFLWNNINGRNSLQDILDKFCNSFNVSKNKAQKDIDLFLINYIRESLIQVKK